MARYHQNITINGEDVPCENSNRKKSKFWNEGKWNHFVEPLLVEDCSEMTFVEFGCNVGLYLKMAKERGFRNVAGFEKGRMNCKMAGKYRDSLGLDYQIFNKTIDRSFSFDSMPLADYTLLANFHYYLSIDELVYFLDSLYYKTVYCIVVSRKLKDDGGYWKHGHWMPSGEYENIRNMFRNWTEIGAIRTNEKDLNDPHSRELWSLIFKSNLNRDSIDGYNAVSSEKSLERFAHTINVEPSIKAVDTEYYQKWKNRKQNSWPDKKTKKFVQDKMDMMNDVKSFGIKDPILVHLNKYIADGNHRRAMLKELGYKTMIARII